MDSNTKEIIEKITSSDKSNLCMLADIDGDLSEEAITQILKELSDYPFFMQLFKKITKLNQERDLAYERYQQISNTICTLSHSTALNLLEDEQKSLKGAKRNIQERRK